MTHRNLKIVTLVDRYPSLSETFIQREIEELRHQGVSIEVTSLRGDQSSRLQQIRVPATVIRYILRHYILQPSRCLSLLRRAGQAQALVKLLQSERMHLKTVLLAQFAWVTADVCHLAAGVTRTPLAVRAHARDVFIQTPESLAKRLQKADLVLPCNSAAARKVLESGYPSDKTRMIFHGLPLQDSSWDWHEPQESERIIGIGRLVPKKGVDLLLKAFAEIACELPQLNLEWIGDGPQSEKLLKLAESLKLQDRVVFSGALSPEETRRRLCGSALLVLPSVVMPDGDRDGIANVLLEAMAVGVPVVTTDAGSASDLVTDGANGLIAEAGNPGSLAETIRHAMSSLTLRRNLAIAGRRTVETNFSLKNNTARLREALAALV